MLNFSGYRLEEGPHRIKTGEREFALVPVEGEFEVRIGPETYKGKRQGGPFAALPGTGNASAVYVPAGAEAEITGRGEMVYFSAPADGQKPPAYVKAGDRENVKRGSGVWLREVTTLFTPDDVSTVLVGGETYSPPGLWSGTPLHVHDKNDPQHGQSDHEEVYYHLARNTVGSWGPFGVQLLFDNEGLDESYLIHDHDAFAIPGAAHPVVAGPNSDMLYIWSLAGPSSELAMYDVPEFAYLKKVGVVLDQMNEERPRRPLTKSEFDHIVKDNKFNEHEAHVLKMHLKQQGFEITE
jgi:5-deoxy-D-glucuronate isomerase